MAVVLYINKLGDDSIAIIGTVRRYFDLSFFEVSDLLEQELPIELPPLDDTYVDAFISEMGQVQSEINRAPTVSMEQIFESLTATFNTFGQMPSERPKPTTEAGGEALCPCGSGKPLSQCHGRGAAKPASDNVELVMESVGGSAFKILGIITKAYGLSYGDAGKYLRTGSKLPALPADEAAKVAEQLRALGCTVRS